MFNVEAYEKSNGESPVRDLLLELDKAAAANKSARIRRNKITMYIDKLKQYGTRIGEPVMKHLEDGVWELRPIDDRILFFFAKNNTYILLHSFVKKSQKTPRSEIEQAKREMKDYIERNK
jgi:phage-related protein